MEETRTQTKTRRREEQRAFGWIFAPTKRVSSRGSSDSFFGVENDDDDDDSHNNIDAEEKERDVAFCIDRGGTFTDVYCEYVESGRKKSWRSNCCRKIRRITRPHPGKVFDARWKSSLENPFRERRKRRRED